MEPWRVRRQYRALARRARRPGRAGSVEAARLENAVVQGLLLLDRYEARLSALRFERRCARALLARTRQLVVRSNVLDPAPAPLVCLPDEAAVEAWAEAVEARGLDTLRVRELLGHLRALDARIGELEQRLRDGAAHLDPPLQRLRERLRAEGLITP